MGNDGDFGAALEQDLRDALFLNKGKIPNSSLSSLPQFMDSSIKVIRRRLRNSQSSTDPLEFAVFILCPRLVDFGEGIIPQKEPFFDDGSVILNGKIWFTQTTATNGFWLSLPFQNPNEIFKYIKTNLGKGEFPTIIFNPKATNLQIRFYPDGVSNDDVFSVVSIQDKTFSKENLTFELDRFYDNYLQTPLCTKRGPKVWKNASENIPNNRAENIIQEWLAVFLEGAFGSCFVKCETNTPLGRADMLIVEKPTQAGGGWVYHAAIELKALRGFTAGGFSVGTTAINLCVSKGLKQAKAYQMGTYASLAFLCCYDLRPADDNDLCFKLIGALASKMEVELKRWYLYKSSEAARDALVT